MGLGTMQWNVTATDFSGAELTPFKVGTASLLGLKKGSIYYDNAKPNIWQRKSRFHNPYITNSTTFSDFHKHT